MTTTDIITAILELSAGIGIFLIVDNRKGKNN